MSTLADVTAGLIEQRAILLEVMTLLSDATPLVAWSSRTRNALLTALSDEGLTSSEPWKVTALRRHLCGTTALTLPPRTGAAPISPAEHATAERLRADLPGLVRLRCAVGLELRTSAMQ